MRRRGGGNPFSLVIDNQNTSSTLSSTVLVDGSRGYPILYKKMHVDFVGGGCDHVYYIFNDDGITHEFDITNHTSVDISALTTGWIRFYISSSGYGYAFILFE